MSVGANIRRRRVELRMSQQELADAMGYKSRSTIAKIESEENDVSQKKLQRFAQVLDTTPEDLFFGYRASTAAPPPGSAALDKTRNKNVAIILAGGKTGKNLQSIPTQFINVQGKPIFLYSMEVYQQHQSVDEIYVVCVRGWENIVKDCAAQYNITKLRGIVLGGQSAVKSLRVAIEHIKKNHGPECMVLIQEATRPRVTTEMISTLLLACEEKGTATFCHAMKDYVQFQVGASGTNYVDRNSLVALQSPEAHRLSLLCRLYDDAQQQNHPLTESSCTMLLYQMGYDISFIDSEVNNIKLIRKADISAFQALVQSGYSY